MTERLNWLNWIHDLRALGSITTNKASGGDGIPVELFQILRDDAVKVLDSICQQIGKLRSGHRTGKKAVLIAIPKKGNAKECSNYHTIVLVTNTSKVMQKSSKLGFNSTWTENFQIFKVDLEKAERNQRSNDSLDHRKSKRITEKHLLLHHWLQ